MILVDELVFVVKLKNYIKKGPNASSMHPSTKII